MADPETTERATDRGTPRAAPPAPIRVRVLHSPRPPSVAELVVEGPLSVGRSGSGASLELDDTRVSRRHLTIMRAGSRVALADASTNGTFVNSRPIKTAHAEDGDVVRVGDSLLLVRVGELEPDAEVPALLGDSPSIRALRREIALLAASDAPLVVTGESGSGKELVARGLHALSGRGGELVAVNCAAIPETLAESTLFGHVTGAFTGARSDAPGVFRGAHRGTLFLDEVAELPIALQPKLLRVLEDGLVTPLGSTRATKVDVRVVCATHRHLAADVESGRFRGDLHARLAGLTLDVPPLRERPEDVLLLLDHMLGPGHPAISADLAEALVLHRWPYNVRELRRVADELGIRGRGVEKLERDMIERRLDPLPRDRDDASAPAVDETPDDARVRELFERHGGNVSRIAADLGRSRRQVTRYLDALGLRRSE